MAQRGKGLVIDVSIHTLHAGNGSGHDLVEHVVGSLQRLLRDDTSLLQQVGLDISTSQLARRSEMDTDELTLFVDITKICVRSRVVGRHCADAHTEG